MKKKIFTAALAVLTVMAIVISGIAVYAAGKPTYKVNSTADNGKLTVSVTLPGNAGAAGGNFTLKYNSENLQFDHVEGNTVGQFNPAYGEDTMRLSFASAFQYTEDTVLVTIVFNIKNGKISADDISLTAYKLYDENASLINSQDGGEADYTFTCNHKFGDWVIIKEPTENEEGLKERVCSVCGETEAQVIETLEPSETESSETAPSETEPSETEPSETEPSETEPSETEPSETEPSETEPSETEPSETEPSETEPSETKPSETEPSETEPSETEPSETEPSETKPSETEPSETKPSETDHSETEPGASVPEVPENPSTGSASLTGVAILAIVAASGVIVLKKKKEN